MASGMFIEFVASQHTVVNLPVLRTILVLPLGTRPFETISLEQKSVEQGSQL